MIKYKKVEPFVLKYHHMLNQAENEQQTMLLTKKKCKGLLTEMTNEVKIETRENEKWKVTMENENHGEEIQRGENSEATMEMEIGKMQRHEQCRPNRNSKR